MTPFGRCVKCLLPAKVPGAGLDASGICRLCRTFDGTNPSEEENKRSLRQADLEKALKERRHQAEYDCLVCLSGGKDSVYLLYKLVREYRLRVLAYTDGFDLPRVAWDNIRRAIRKLDVDHLVYKPRTEFYRKFIRHLLLNQQPSGAVRTVCYVWAPLREGFALKLAMEKKIPLILSGYSPGQPDEDRMVYEMPRKLIDETDWTPPALAGVLDERDLECFWNPFRYPKGSVFPRFLAPFHAWPYDQREAVKKSVELGLVRNTAYASPLLSNFTINWLLMYSDLKNLGYNPYAPEFCKLIREGRASRGFWRWMGPLGDFMIRHRVLLGRNVNKALKWLDLKPHDLVIRRGSAA